MKEYNRKTKRWEEKERAGSLKKRDTCRGKKEHEWVLMLPKYISKLRLLNMVEIAEYYRIKEEERLSEEKFSTRLNAIGINTRGWSHGDYKYYMCKVCRKEKYEYEKNNKI